MRPAQQPQILDAGRAAAPERLHVMDLQPLARLAPLPVPADAVNCTRNRAGAIASTTGRSTRLTGPAGRTSSGTAGVGPAGRISSGTAGAGPAGRISGAATGRGAGSFLSDDCNPLWETLRTGRR